MSSPSHSFSTPLDLAWYRGDDRPWLMVLREARVRRVPLSDPILFYNPLTVVPQALPRFRRPLRRRSFEAHFNVIQCTPHYRGNLDYWLPLFAEIKENRLGPTRT